MTGTTNFYDIHFLTLSKVYEEFKIYRSDRDNTNNFLQYSLHDNYKVFAKDLLK